MTARKPDLDAEAARIAAEYEMALAEVAAGEQSHQIEIHRLAGQVVLNEITVEEARTKRAALDADLAVKHDHLAVLKDAIPEIERRRVEEEQHRRQLAIKQSGERLAKALTARYNASKNVARAMRDLDSAAAELLRHRGLVEEDLGRHLGVLGDEPFTWPERAAVDEAWEVTPELQEFVAGGPITPLADAQREEEELERTRAVQEDEILTWACQRPTAHRLSQIPESLRSHPRVVQAEREGTSGSPRRGRRAACRARRAKSARSWSKCSATSSSVQPAVRRNATSPRHSLAAGDKAFQLMRPACGASFVTSGNDTPIPRHGHACADRGAKLAIYLPHRVERRPTLI